MPTKELHPTDISDFALIDSAEYFVASIFIGTGKFDKSEQSDLGVARRVASEMTQHYRNGRKGMVYAVLPNNRSVFVPDRYQPEEKEMSNTDQNTDEGIPAFLKRDEAPAAAAKPAKAKAAKKIAAKPKGKQVSRGVLTDKGKKTLAKPAAEKKAKATKAPKEAKTKAPRPAGGQRAAVLEAAKRGEMPTPPDFSANTHKPHRKRLDEVIALAEAGDVKGLKAFQINTTSTSPKAIDRYRNLAVMALSAKKAA